MSIRIRAGRWPQPIDPPQVLSPPLPELLARCQEETGLPAPKPPVWT